MLHLKPTFKISPTMSKYIFDCTNKSIERKLNKSNLNPEIENPFIKIPNTEVAVVSKTLYLCSFFCIISFLAGYQFKSFQNKL